MNDKLKSIPLPPPLPATREELLKDRHLKQQRTLNDYVEDVYVSLAEDADFQKLVWAVHDSQAAEGSLSADNFMAAQMIRDTARKMGNPAKDENLTTIKLALGVVLRRYRKDRKSRRNMIHGEVMPTENDIE